MFVRSALAIPLALLLDWLLGDPPTRFHPTAWMGNLIAQVLRVRPGGAPGLEFTFGMLVTLLGMFLSFTVGAGLSLLVFRLPVWMGVLLQALVLKLTLSLHGLWRAAGQVGSALEADDLPEARRLTSWHLVSRDTSALDGASVSAATIESVAENASDGVIAPLFFFVLGGLPLALAYRFLNTADSMLGYRDSLREWLGKFPARLDDVFNYLPARITGACFVIASLFVRRADAGSAWRTMWRDACLTASPNAGTPMSAMAGALGVELEKNGVYCLGGGNRLPDSGDIQHARCLLVYSVIVVVPVFSLVLAL